MGAAQFEVVATGDSPHDAFIQARDEALWEHGHGGYTGTIAEKYDFVLAQGKPTDMDPQEYVTFLEHEGFEAVYPQAGTMPPFISHAQRQDVVVYHEKWGPALCIPLAAQRTYLFTGWASS